MEEAQPTTYTRRGGGDLSDENLALVEQRLAERSEMKQQGDFKAADEIRARLAADFNVRIDDRNMQWHLETQDYVQAPSLHNFDEDTLAFIQDQVNQRVQAKIEKDYQKADSIRDSLIDEFSVVIEDRVKGMNVAFVFSIRVCVCVCEKCRLQQATNSFLTFSVLSEWMIVGRPKNSFALSDSISIESSDTDSVSDGGDDDDDDDSDDFEGVLEREIVEAVQADITEEADPTLEGNGDLETLTVVQLKERLRSRGLPVSGRKAELIERLQQ